MTGFGFSYGASLLAFRVRLERNCVLRRAAEDTKLRETTGLITLLRERTMAERRMNMMCIYTPMDIRCGMPVLRVEVPIGTVASREYFGPKFNLSLPSIHSSLLNYFLNLSRSQTHPCASDIHPLTSYVICVTLMSTYFLKRTYI